METRSQFKERLKQEGKWHEFLSIRDKFKSEGYEAKDAYMLAAEKVANQHIASGSVDGLVVSRELFAGKDQASARKIVQWIFDSIGIDDLRCEDAPSSGAWSYLQSLRNSPILLQDFYRNVWTKTLPSKSEIDNARKFEDDGREQLDLIDKIEKASRNSVL